MCAQDADVYQIWHCLPLICVNWLTQGHIVLEIKLTLIIMKEDFPIKNLNSDQVEVSWPWDLCHMCAAIQT